MELTVVAILLSFVVTGIVVFTLYFCTCCQTTERDRSLPRTNHMQTIAFAPEEDWSHSASHAGQEFQDLFTNVDHVNADIDHGYNYHSNSDQRMITYDNIDDGFNRSNPGIGFVCPTSRDYGFNYPNFDNGFIYPTIDHSFKPSVNVGPSNIDHRFNRTSTNNENTHQCYSVNENHDSYQSASRHANMALKQIEDPPPSYLEAIQGYYHNASLEQNGRNSFDRGLGSHNGRYCIGSSKRYSGMRGVRTYEIENDDGRGGVANGTGYNSGRGAEENESEYRDETDSVKGTKNSGNRSDDVDCKDGGSGGGIGKELI